MNGTNKPKSTRASAGRRQALVTFAAITAAGLLAIIFNRQLEALARQSILPCGLLLLTGLRCPLCGGTRCVRALLSLDFAGAVYYNPLVVSAAAVGVYMYLRLLLSCARREYTPYRPWLASERGLWWVLAAVVVFLVVRNLPFYQQYLY